MKYDIEVEYITGDSFGSSEEVDKLGFEFVDIKTAEENALRIAEHYKMYERVKPDEFENKRWFVKGCPEWSVMLIDDKGSEFRASTGTWCGYFETLHSVRVVRKDLKELKEFYLN